MPAQSYALDTTWRTLFRDLGVSSANVFRRASLPDDLLSESSARLGAEDYYRLWDSIEAETGDPAFPLRLCQAIRSESFSPPLFAALCSPNLLIAAQRIAKYKPLIAPIEFRVLVEQDTVAIELAWLGTPLSPPVSLVLMELLFCVVIARTGTREPIRPLTVTTRVLPSPRAAYESFFGTSVERGAAHKITFLKADALRPFLTSNEGMWSAFEPELRRRLDHLDAPSTIRERTRAALLEALPSGLLTIEAIARKLALSKRTLQRRIDAEGTSYQHILQETREGLARHYLTNTTLPAAEISFLLGFEEANSFYRAFRSWTGTTPDFIRNGQVAEPV